MSFRDPSVVQKNCSGKGGDGFSFWEEFENFYTVVVNNTRVDKWNRLEEKEERRIKKYLDNLV